MISRNLTMISSEVVIKFTQIYTYTWENPIIRGRIWLHWASIRRPQRFVWWAADVRIPMGKRLMLISGRGDSEASLTHEMAIYSEFSH